MSWLLLTILCAGGAITGRVSASGAMGRGEPPEYSEFCPSPKAAENDWPTGVPDAVGLRGTRIESLLEAARAGELGQLHSVLVVKDGKLVVEAYFGGASREHCQLIASVTKSVTSILVGMSLERSPARSADSPLIELLPDYAEVMRRQGKSAITLAQVLSMTAGLEWDELTHPHPDDRNPNTQMYGQADVKRFILARDLVHPPGETWAYNSGLAVVAGATVGRLTGQSIDKFAEAELFAPLGIGRYHWFKHPDGTVYSNGDLLLTPRSLAKIGLLVLNQGRWRGRQIVSRQWIAESTRRHATARGDLGYGYFWYLGSTIRGGRRYRIVYGSGTGGQRLFVVPELNMVVVVTQRVFGNRAGPFFAARILVDHVIPAALPEPGHERLTPPDEAVLESAVGVYLDPVSHHEVRITRLNDKLLLRPDPLPMLGEAPSRIELTAIAPRRFQGYWPGLGTIVVDLVTDERNAVTGGKLNAMLRDRLYRRAD